MSCLSVVDSRQSTKYIISGKWLGIVYHKFCVTVNNRSDFEPSEILHDHIFRAPKQPWLQNFEQAEDETFMATNSFLQTQDVLINIPKKLTD